MRVTGLFIKPVVGGPMKAVTSVNGIDGGFAGDCQIDQSSPRQVLVFSDAVLSQHQLAAQAIRANVLVDEAVDQLASGTMLTMGSLGLRVTIACESCKKLDKERVGLARALSGSRGILARVVAPGVANAMDPVHVTPNVYRALPAPWKERVIEIVRCIPDGMLLTFTQLARLAGVQSTYCRTFPRLLQRLAEHVSQASRVVPAAKQISDATYWDGSTFYRHEEAN